ncbi:MAG: DegT/DnrJ/EryC1/StrS family aminotransferase [Deltaproteobacteria bacterium]|nr:DegT/DnrJ/EryC1/StrS family aminotransferase [Deltaproteobacteria bacterium]
MPGFEVLGEEERREIMDVLNKGVFFRYEFGDQRGGQWKVRQFEEALCRYTGAAHALAVSSGTAALKVALVGLGLGPGDEIICPGFTFVATWESIFDAGAEPVFAEVDETLGLDPTLIEEKITDRTRAVVAVHMCGGQADIEAIADLAARRGLILIEDTAQALGARIGGRHLGAWGQCGCLSFDAVKTLTCGEGGAIITKDAGLAKTFSEFHDHGHDHAPVGRGNEGRRFAGLNYRMNELQGALGLAQFKKLDQMLATQRENKARLKAALARAPGVSFRRLIDEAGDSATFISWFHQTAQEAERFNAVLSEAGCGAVAWFKNTWHYYRNWEHLHQAKTCRRSDWPFVREDGRRLTYPPDALPASDAVLSRCLSWQIMLNMSEESLCRMEEAISRAAGAL